MSCTPTAAAPASRRPCMATIALALLLAACQRAPTPAATPPAQGAASRPAQAVRELTADLRANDLAGFAQAAVPPQLHAQLETAWRDGRTRWPLDELPFAQRLPDMLSALAAPGSEARLQQVFDRQFSGARAELAAAARALGLFGVQYVSREGDYSDDERAHYAQLLQATSTWAAAAPLGDRQRARRAIPRLAGAARRVGLASGADFARVGMDDSLRRLGPFAATLKMTLADYGLALDRDLAGLDARLQQQTGDTATVRMRYQLAGQDIDTVVGLERIDGRWYLSDYLRHARAAVAAAAPVGATPGTGAHASSKPAPGNGLPAKPVSLKPVPATPGKRP